MNNTASLLKLKSEREHFMRHPVMCFVNDHSEVIAAYIDAGVEFMLPMWMQI